MTSKLSVTIDDTAVRSFASDVEAAFARWPSLAGRIRDLIYCHAAPTSVEVTSQVWPDLLITITPSTDLCLAIRRALGPKLASCLTGTLADRVWAGL